MKKITFILFCLLSSIYAGFAQARTISGTVIDGSTGEEIIGASIMVRGVAEVGTITDFNGHFSLSVPDNATHVIVSFVGMARQELPITSVMNIRMQPDADLVLDEVIVTGKQVIDRRFSTAATERLDASDIMLGGMTDVSRALQGRAAGVSVQNVSGTFGAAPRIRVRGATSIMGDSRPLWVVDGVIVEPIVEVNNDALSSGDALTLISSAIAGLNPDDIETFDILKDGSVTAIYGARAMAGVIVITTRRGQAGRSSVDYTSELTFRMKPLYRNFNIMNSQEQMGIKQEMSNKGWLNLAETFRANHFGVYGRMFQMINDGLLLNAPEARNLYLQQAEMRNTDWFDLLFQNNIMQRHSVAISTGTERATSRASLSILTDPGWSLQSGVNMYTGLLNTTYNISKGLSLSLLGSFSYREQRAPGTMGQGIDMVRGAVGRDFDINPFSFALNSSRALDPDAYYRRNFAPFNIFNELNNNFIDMDVLETRFQGEMRWRPERLRSIEMSFLAAMNYRTQRQGHTITGRSNQAMAYRAGVEPYEDNAIRMLNPLLYRDPFDPNMLPISLLPGATAGIYRVANRSVKTFDTRTTISWRHVFNDKHLVSLFGGYETTLIDRYDNSFTGWGLDFENGLIPNYRYEWFKQGIEQGHQYFSVVEWRTRMLAGFATATYNYDGRYNVNLTLRNEAMNISSVHGSPWLPTWNVGLGWNASEERFFETLRNHISFLSFRSSYSLTAMPVPNNITNSEIFIANFVPFRPFTNIQERGALGISVLQNTELTFEKMNELNLGFDMSFLRNRVNVSFDVFRREMFDLVGMINTTGVGGEILKMANVADMTGRGFDLSVSTRNIIHSPTNRNFTWTTNFILGRAITEITRFDNLTRVMQLVSGMGFAKEGFPARALFSIPFEGLDENGIPMIRQPDGSITSSGHINFQSFDTNYLVYEGQIDPILTGGLANSFNIGRFRVNLFFNYAFGNVVRLNPVFSAMYDDFTAMPREFGNRWTLPGDERYTDIPVILSRRQFEMNNVNLMTIYNAYNFSTARVARGDFIRLQQLSVHYDFPERFMLDNMNSFSLGIEGMNLFLLYADRRLNGQDPEFMNAGGVATPIPRQFTFFVRASF